MEIGGLTSRNSISGMQMITTAPPDSTAKSIQNEITDAKQQLQKISSQEDLSANEKATEQKKLQKEISDLNTELRQHQDELRASRKREIMLAKLQEDQKPAEEENAEDKTQSKESSANQVDENSLPTGSGQTTSQGTTISDNSDGTVILKEEKSPAENREADTDNNTDAQQDHEDLHTMISADASLQHADRQGTIIAKTKDGIAILKGEMHLDELRGEDTEKKQAALEKMEQKEEKAEAFQFSLLGEAANTKKTSAETSASGSVNQTPVVAQNSSFFNDMNLSQNHGSPWVGHLL